jgi:integrase
MTFFQRWESARLQRFLDAIRMIEKRDAIEMAKRVMQMASGVFRYGVATARCRRDPTTDLRGALKPARATKHRTALPPSEIPAFMAELESYDGDLVTKLGMKLLVLTFVRTAELRFARWLEFEGLGTRGAIWRIPSERMKMRRVADRIRSCWSFCWYLTSPARG